MTKTEFMDALRNEGFDVKEVENTKGTGVTWQKPDVTCEVAPVVYSNFWEGLTDISEALDIVPPSLDVQSILTKEFFDEHAVLQIAKTNSQADYVTKRRLDLQLSIRLYVPIANGTIHVNQAMLDTIGISKEDAFKIATANTKARLSISSIRDTLIGMGVSADILPSEESMGMYVVSSDDKMFGASVLACPSVIKRFCISKGVSECWIIPSSIHEVILIINMDATEEQLRNMITDVNTTEVAPEDVLSGHPYRFNGEKIVY